MASADPSGAFQQALEHDLTTRYGPIVSGDTLRLVLGYPSQDAFRQALARKTVPIPIFTLENRRGKFAFVRDVAAWLTLQRDRALASTDMSPPSHRPTGGEP